MNRPYTSLGKEVLHHDAHFADCISTTAADDIAAAMNILDDIRAGETLDAALMPELPLEASDVIAARHAVRQENDEYACACGSRWAVSEGEAHP